MTENIEDKCINHYIGGNCNNKVNPLNTIKDGCGRPLSYCDDCF